MGLSFSLPPRSESVVNVLAAIQDLQAKAKDIAPELNTIKGFALTGLNELTKPRGGLPRRLHRAKQSLQHNQDIIITKSDKGNSIVILNKADYILYGEDMLSDTSVYQRLKKNPLKTEQTSFNTRLDDIFKKMPSKLPNKFLAYLPSLPFMKLSPKIHKPSLCFRPIVSQSQAFTKNLAKHLSKILTPLLGTFSTAHLLNSTQLKQRLLEEADPNLPFLSLDFESLFTNVPLTPYWTSYIGNTMKASYLCLKGIPLRVY